MVTPSLVSKFSLLKRVFIKDGNPVYLIHFVTNKCNGRCDFCFFHEDINTNIPDELTLEEIEKITKKYGKIYQVILTGGEPFARLDLPEIANLYYKNCGVEQMSISTNATLTKLILEKTEIILKNIRNIPINVNLSLNGIGEDHDNVIHVPKAFEKFVETYNLLVDLKKKYSNLGLQITSTLSPINEKKFLDLFDYCVKNFPEAVFQPNLIRGETKISKKVDMKIYKELSKRMKKERQHRKNTPFARLSAAKNLARGDIIVKTVESNKYITPCYAGKLIGVLYANGDIFPCEILNKKIGNIKDYNYNFSSLWNSKNNKEIVKFIRNSKCFCTHECFYTVNLLFNPRNYFRIIKEFFRT